MSKKDFSFVDLFAGIGGFRVGLTVLGGRCVYSNENDRFSAKTYSMWFGEDGLSTDDIRTVDKRIIPQHDILCAGFPCQPFSISGVSKKNSLGRGHGFADIEHGNLFSSILDTLDSKHPKVLFLENVKNLKYHTYKSDKTWNIIQKEIEDRDFKLFHSEIDSKYV